MLPEGGPVYFHHKLVALKTDKENGKICQLITQRYCKLPKISHIKVISVKARTFFSDIKQYIQPLQQV